MPRFARRMLAFAVLALALTHQASAEPPNPFDLVDGLRKNGMSDLALQLLDEVGKTAPPELKAVIPLEKARVRLSMADDAEDDGEREVLTSQARTDLAAFLKGNPNHPRAIEANVALAQATAIQAKTILTRAINTPIPPPGSDPGAISAAEAQMKATAVTARKPFTDAADAFGKAAKQLEEKIASDAALSPKQKSQLSQELIQTELDRAITTYQLSRTYIAPTAAERINRAKAIEDARDQFLAVAKKYPDTSGAWVAKAWTGECYVATDTPKDADKMFADVKRNATQTSLAGRRMVRFFEARIKYGDALSTKTPAAYTAARQACSDWLRDFGAGRSSPEFYAILYYDSYLKLNTARAMVKQDDNKQPVVPQAAMPLIREAERQFRRIADSDNEYSDRASTQQMIAVRLLAGNAEKDPATIRQFDEAVMAAMVQFDNALNSKDNQKQALQKVVALLERAKSLPAPRDAARELLNTQVRLSFAYLLADRPFQAAVLGEHIARTGRVSKLAARAGLYAVQAYLAAANKLPPDDTAGRISDRERAISLGMFLDSNKSMALDPSTDTVRTVVGQLLLQEGRHKEAFEILSRVSPKSDRAIVARLMEGGAAFELIRPGPDGKPQAGADAIYKKLIADINSIPQPPPDAVVDTAELYSRLQLLLAQAHLANGAGTYKLAETQADKVAKLVPTFTQLSDEDKAVLGMQAELARLSAVYGQVIPLVTEGKFSDVATRLEPELAKIKQAGAAVKAGQMDDIATAAKQLDNYRREKVIILALQTQIRLKSVDKAGELFDLLKTLGGSLDSSIQALNQLLAVVRPQIDELTEMKKEEDVKALIDGMANLLEKVAAEPNLTPRVQMFLGRGLKEIGAYEKALEVLEKVPAPTPELLAMEVNKIEDNDARVNVLMYRGSRLDLARVNRELKKFDEAEKILNDAMGTEEKPSWAKKAQDFRKESIYLKEARAAAQTDPVAANKLWGEAKQGWDKYAGEFRASIVQPLPALPPVPKVPADNAPPAVQRQYQEDMKKFAAAEKKQNDAKRNKDTMKPLYFEAYYESLRCLATANDQVLKDKPDRLRELMKKVADSVKQVEDNNKDLDDGVKAKLASLREKFPLLKEEYEKLVAATPPPMTNPDGTPITTTTNTPTTKPTDDTPKPVTPPPVEASSNTPMLIAGVIGILGIGITAMVILKAKKKKAAPRKYGSGAPKAAKEPPPPRDRSKAKSKAGESANGTEAANGKDDSTETKTPAAPRKPTTKS